MMAAQARTSSRGERKLRTGDVRAPERTCAACRRVGHPSRMIRWVRSDDGMVVPDLRGSAFGRGAWVHPHLTCLRRLVPALSRSFRAPVTVSLEEALGLLRAAADKRTRDLLGAARRQRRIAIGSDATEDALKKDQARLVVVAQDARAAAETSFVRQAMAQGLAQVWGTKEGVGQIVGRPEVGVLAILDDRLAAALFDAIAMAHLQGAPAGGPSGRADVSAEVE